MEYCYRCGYRLGSVKSDSPAARANAKVSLAPTPALTPTKADAQKDSDEDKSYFPSAADLSSAEKHPSPKSLGLRFRRPSSPVVFVFSLVLILTGLVVHPASRSAARTWWERLVSVHRGKTIISPLAEGSQDRLGLAYQRVLAGLAFPGEEGVFGGSRCETLVPLATQAYLEFFSPEVFLETHILSQITFSIQEAVGLELIEALSYLREGVCLTKIGQTWAFLGLTRDVDFVQSRLDGFGQVDLVGELIGDYLVVANATELVSQIRDVADGLALSLGHDAAFARARRRLPSEGYLFLFSNQRDSDLAGYLRRALVDDLGLEDDRLADLDLGQSAYVFAAAEGGVKVVY